MPSAQSKSSQPATTNGDPELLQEPVKVVISALEKKLRNLEKRKLKLKEYENRLKAGQEINAEQKKAASDLILVENSMKTIADLHKNMITLDQEYVKLSRKDAKRAKMVADQAVCVKVSSTAFSILEVQAILAAFTEEVREDFISEGLIAEEELAMLDQIYTLLSPSCEGKMSESVSQCSAHMLALIEEKDAVAYEGVTYKQVAQLLRKVKESGYFDKEDEPEPEPEPEVEAEPEAEEAAAENHIDEAVETEFSSPEPEDGTASPAAEETADEEAAVVDSSEVISNGINGSCGGVILPPEIEEKCDGEAIDFFGDEESDEEIVPEESVAPVAVVVDEEPETESMLDTPPPEPVLEPMEFTNKMKLNTVPPTEEAAPTLNAGSPEFYPRNGAVKTQPAQAAVPEVNGWTPPEENSWQSVERRTDHRANRENRGNRGAYRSRGDGRGGRGGNRGGDGERRGRGGNFRRGGGDGNYRGGDGGFRGEGRGGRGSGNRDGGNRGRNNYYNDGERRGNNYNRGGYNSNRGGGQQMQA